MKFEPLNFRSLMSFAMNCFLLFCVGLIFSVAPLSAQENSTAKPEKYVLGWVSEDSIYHGMPMVKPDEETYVPDSSAMAMLLACHDSTEILVFFGSWCKDSKRELPRFFSTLHNVKNDLFHVRYLGLDRSKKDAAGIAERYHITNIPTFVFLCDGVEIGRIVEEPQDQLEKEWAKVIQVDPATAKRQEVWRMMREAMWPVMFRAGSTF